MINIIAYPVIEKLVLLSKVKIRYHKSLFVTVIVSDFLPQQSHDFHTGILEAVKYRLIYPEHYIIFLSFHSKEYLLHHDPFGIISLNGTDFIRLPFLPEQLIKTIEKNNYFGSSIPKVEWIMFATNASKILLKDKISLLNHGNKLELLSLVTSPLGGSCRAMSDYPTVYPPIINRQLQSVKQFITEELSDLIEMATVLKNMNDPYLQNVVEFANSLYNLKNFSFTSQLNVTTLLSLINAVDDSFDKIKKI